MAYSTRRPAERLTIPVRGLNYCVYRWGDPGAVPVFLLHGWADTGMSFQFIADEISEEFCLLAPDLRGFGDSDWNPQGYWFPDYLADLDVLINELAGNREIKLVGHSMGGNIILLYAGIFPDRISHVVSLEQFGLADNDPAMAPDRYAQWLKQWRDPPQNGVYGNTNDMQQRLQALAPYLTDDRAVFLAPFWLRETGDGKFVSKIDPGHKRTNPVLYRREEARACWRNITARVLLVLGDESGFYKQYHQDGIDRDFESCFKSLSEVVIHQSGHMLHLDQPEQVANILEHFLLQ